jgi:hypothetical protein
MSEQNKETKTSNKSRSISSYLIIVNNILVKITTPTRVNVGYEEIGVTVSTIATEAVSTCHFILLLGYYNT